MRSGEGGREKKDQEGAVVVKWTEIGGGYKTIRRELRGLYFAPFC